MAFPATSQPLGDFGIAVAWVITDAQTELKEQQAWGAACADPQIAADMINTDMPRGGR